MNSVKATMKHYKKPDGSIWAYELDGSQDGLIADDMVPCSEPVPADPPEPTPDDLKASLINAVQAHLDEGAQALGYDDIKTAATYAGEAAVPRFQNEGRALRSWRSYCWDHCRVVMDAVTAGERAIPTETELLQELPVLVLEAVPA